MAGPYVAALGDLGYAKESVFGTPVAATAYVPLKDESLEKNPGLFGLKLMRGIRETNTYLMPGEQKISGNTTFPLFSIMGMALVVGSIGTEQSTTGSTPTGSTTLAATAAIGATQISTTATFSVSNVIQIDSNSSSKAECRMVTAVTGAGPYTLTVDQPTRFQHSNGATVAAVVAPYTHNVIEANNLASFTLEKNLGGLTSIQYAGCVANKLTLKAATKSEVEATIDWMGQSDAQITPTVATYTTDLPIELAGVSFSLFGSSDANVESGDFSLDNYVKAHYTFSGKRTPTFLPATERQIQLKLTESLQAMTYYNQMPTVTQTITPPVGAQTMICTSGTDVITFTLPQMSIIAHTDPMKMGDLVMEDFTLESWLGSQANTMSLTVVNSQYLNF